MGAPRKPCPECAEEIMAVARVCKFCGWGKSEPARSQPQRSSPWSCLSCITAVVLSCVVCCIALLVWHFSPSGQKASQDAERARRLKEAELDQQFQIADQNAKEADEAAERIMQRRREKEAAQHHR